MRRAVAARADGRCSQAPISVSLDVRQRTPGQPTKRRRWQHRHHPQPAVESDNRQLGARLELQALPLRQRDDHLKLGRDGDALGGICHIDREFRMTGIVIDSAGSCQSNTGTVRPQAYAGQDQQRLAAREFTGSTNAGRPRPLNQGGEEVITVVGLSVGGVRTAALDSVRITSSVPEPAGWALLVGGLLILGAATGQRRG